MVPEGGVSVPCGGEAKRWANLIRGGRGRGRYRGWPHRKWGGGGGGGVPAGRET